MRALLASDCNLVTTVNTVWHLYSMKCIPPPKSRIGNKKVILAGTNNYLGLTFNHDAISEGQAALAPKAPAPPVLVWQTAVMRRTWR